MRCANYVVMSDDDLSFFSCYNSYCSIFLIIYLQARLNNLPRINNTCVRWFVRGLQYGMIILSFWISLTRISDWRHHPLDVLDVFIGAIVGITVATVTQVVIGDVFGN